jgi:DNA end-binding protein Ku
MPRALWAGAISFGLVNVPVELYPAEDRRSFAFAMLDKRDFSLVGYKRYSKRSGREVEWSDIVKGYEYKPDQFVVLTDDDFRRANPKASQTIDIHAFVGANEIPVEFFETPYYLAPAKRGSKVYALLRETLRSAERVAVAEVVVRTRQHRVALVPRGRALVMMTLRYPDELRPPSGFEVPPESLKGAGISAREVALAKRLVEDMTERFDPTAYKNRYHDDLMARVRQKVKQGRTREITGSEEDSEPGSRSAEVIDLAALLQSSLGKPRGASGDSKSKPAPRLHVVPRAAAARQAARTHRRARSSARYDRASAPCPCARAAGNARARAR